MAEKITIEKIEENMELFKKMYDDVRIVNPLYKRVIEWKNSYIEPTDDICYKYWERGEICENCISIRAHLNDKTYFKLEQTDSVTMLVTAIPIEAEEPVVIELLKNATDSMLIGEGDYNEGEMIRTLVDDLNPKVVEDSLTCLKNRRYIDERLPVEIVKAAIEEKPLSIIFMDIDDLKLINDSYGHQLGDSVLKEVGKVLCGCIRDKLDWAARYGGDEFLICLNNTRLEEAEKVGSRIREEIEKISIKEDESFKIGVSMGIYTMEGEKLTPEELIHRADKKMYQAKEAKRAGIK